MRSHLLTFVMLVCLQTLSCAIVPTSRVIFGKENMRAQKALEMMGKKSCDELVGSKSCTLLKSQLPHQMNFYMASKLYPAPGHDRLKVVKALKDKKIGIRLRIGRLNHLDSVVVVDPLPEAHFGHTVVVFLIRNDLTKAKCDEYKGWFYKQASGKDECMYLPDYEICMTMGSISGRVGKAVCSFNTIPFVYDKADVHQKQRLNCVSNLEGFSVCPVVKFLINDKCNNGKKCSQPVGGGAGKCHWTCDYAVLLSGGWNKYVNNMRYLRNAQEMFSYLNYKRGFQRKNMKVFFANNASINLDNNHDTQDAVPATDSTRILNHMRSVCQKSPKCIDTFVLYLNGPTLPNGNLLLWDRDSNGETSASEQISIKYLLEPFKSCGAKNYLIIADQNYAGHIVEEVRNLRKNGFKNFNKMHVVTASSKVSYSWRQDFTKAFIEHDNVNIDSSTETASSRRISFIFNDLKTELSEEYKVDYLSGTNTDLTVSGHFGQTPGCSTIIPPRLGWEKDKSIKGKKKRRSYLGT